MLQAVLVVCKQQSVHGPHCTVRVLHDASPWVLLPYLLPPAALVVPVKLPSWDAVAGLVFLVLERNLGALPMHWHLYSYAVERVPGIEQWAA